MNNTYTIEGITLKTYNFSEYDKVFVIFSKENGLLRAIAKNIRKSKNNFGGMLEPLNVNRILLRKGKNLEQIYQSEIVKSFIGIRKDYDKLIYTLFLFEMIVNFLHDGEISENIYNLLIQTLDFLEVSENILPIIIFFEINFLKLIGYENDYYNCYSCQKDLLENKLGFDIYSGNIFCDNCIKKNSKVIDAEILNSIRKIKNGELENINNFYLEEIQKLFKIYISHLSEKKIKTLDIIG
ncbi:MAG: DNA repair protein RecO [Candidatus Sericytochromatia bacterium]|nr:MAG: DNA repair protein RecO [Candidatus Sericytochromatia bacterium]